MEASKSEGTLKPVIDGEPSYEDIPQGLHDVNETRWMDYDVRRYAYWSVFAGSFGHTYGHNSIMQFHSYGKRGSFGPGKPWWEALNDPGFSQMQYMKDLMLALPYFERVPEQSVIAGQNGERSDRAVAIPRIDHSLVYN